MSNVMKFCGCKACRCGMRSKVGSATVKRLVRHHRRTVRQQLKRGIEPDKTVSVPLTD